MLSSKEARERILRRTRKELTSGMVVNLGVGLPVQLADLIAAEDSIHLHSENGILGVGPTPAEADIDPQLINASKQPVTVNPGASYFDSATSFAMIRGGHVDVAVLGALQIDENGLLANWFVPGQNILGVGGAMDLVSGVKRVIVTTTHCTKTGEPKIVNECAYPITALRPVDVIITERVVMRWNQDHLVLEEIGEGYSLDDVKKSTTASFETAAELTTFS